MPIPLQLDPLADIRRRLNPLSLAQSSITSELPELNPTEQESLLAELAGSVGSGLSWIGQTLDKPGRAVRGLLAGQPSELLNLIPFSDTLGITDPQQSVSGRDLLTEWGLTEPNNPDEWELADFLGFGAEVLTDPLLPLGLGKGALTASGKAARAAGVLDDAARIAGTGPRVARMTTTLDDLAAQSAQAAEAIQRAGGVLGTGEPLGGVASYFGHPFYGPTAQKVGGALDILGEAVRTSAPVRYLTSAFHRPVQGTLEPEVQKIAAGAYEQTARDKAQLDEFIAKQMTRRLDAGLIGPEAGQAIRMVMEQVDPADVSFLKSINPDLPDKLMQHPVVQEIGRDLRAMDDALAITFKDSGVDIPTLIDTKGKHSPRQISPDAQSGASARGRIPLGGTNRFKTRRIRPLRDIGGMTEGVRTIVADPAIEQVAQNAAMKPADKVKWLAQHIDQKYGAIVPQQMLNAKGNLVDQRQALARYIMGLSSKARAEGLFPNDVIFDFRRSLHTALESRNARDAVFNTVTQTALHDPNGSPLGELLTDLGIKHGKQGGGFMRDVADKLGKSYKDAKQLRIAPRIADDLRRYYKSFSGPDSVSAFTKIWDSANSLFKMGVLAWPSRHVRDFVSGMFSNWVGGEIKSPQDIGDAWKLLRGETVKGAANIPIIKETMRIRNLTGDENATKVLRELVFAQNLITKYGNIAGEITGNAIPSKGTFEDLVASMPGAHPLDLGNIARQAVPRDLESLNPLNIRGVGDRDESKFFVANTSEEVGYLTDSMNRLVPFISQLKRGVDPRTAKLKTAAMQVDYTPGAYTPLERQVISRMVPFYRFTKGQVPWVLKQLWEHPGGKLPQIIRATDEARAEGFVPDYVGTGTAIPLGQTDEGTQRFLSSLGLAHETVFDLFRPGRNALDTATETLGGLMGNLSPYLKLPIEIGTGTQLFTGRDLDELDSRLGRILNPNQPVNVPVLAEEALMNSPLSKAITTVGTLVDPRKSWGDVALNTLTGARITDVDMSKAKYFASREALDKLLSSNPAVRKYSSLYVKNEDLDRLDPSQQRAYALYRNVQKESQARARERRIANATP